MAQNQILGGADLTANPRLLIKRMNDEQRERSLARSLQEQEFRARQIEEERERELKKIFAQQQQQMQQRVFDEGTRRFNLDYALQQQQEREKQRQFNAEMNAEDKELSLSNALKQQSKVATMTPYQQASLDLSERKYKDENTARIQKMQAVEKQRAIQQDNESAMIEQSAKDQLRAIYEVEEAGIDLFGVRSMIPAIPGTPKETWNANINKLLSQEVLNLMTKLKQASKTGATGFGQLSEKELVLLYNAATALRKTLSPEKAQEYINTIREGYTKVLGGGTKKFNEYGLNPADPRIGRALVEGYSLEEIKEYLGA